MGCTGGKPENTVYIILVNPNRLYRLKACKDSLMIHKDQSLTTHSNKAGSSLLITSRL
jgi:hypothetical protein